MAVILKNNQKRSNIGVIPLKEERYEKIMNILEQNSFATVEELSRKLYVSMPTVRRDLNDLQKMGLVIRSHGGAMRRTGMNEGQPVMIRSSVNAAEKMRLSQAASKLLYDDCVIFLDESSTTQHIIEYIPDYKNITVITNSLTLLVQLNKHNIPAYCIGGKLDTDNQSFIGSMAEDMVTRFNIDIMFFSTSGINEKSMIVDYCEGANDLRRRALPYAHKKVYLCDSSKFGKRAAYSLCPLWSVDTILVNAPLPDYMNTGNAEVIVI